MHEVIHSPLIRLAKRDSIKPVYAAAIRIGSVILALILGGLLISILGHNPIEAYYYILEGSISSEAYLQMTIRNAIPLLGCALAIAPCFKMRFWNIGAEGQITAGALAATWMFRLLNEKYPPIWTLILMALAAIIGGGLWAVIPGFFKAVWNTNETLFTLMMNYIIIGIVAYLEAGPWNYNQGHIKPFPEQYALPEVFGIHCGWIIVLGLVVLLYLYMRHTKHGYEIAVIGDSARTAQYAGMNVGWIMVRTMFLSGAICGLVGFIIAAGQNHKLASGIANGVGFTAITVAWLSQLNPFTMVLISMMLAILTRGAGSLQTELEIPLAISDVIIGLLLFSMLGCEFFINFRMIFRKKHKKQALGKGAAGNA